jgi:hypothetical protein
MLQEVLESGSDGTLKPMVMVATTDIEHHDDVDDQTTVSHAATPAITNFETITGDGRGFTSLTAGLTDDVEVHHMVEGAPVSATGTPHLAPFGARCLERRLLNQKVFSAGWRI